ncbi:hypothetical protein T265_03449 [Opisthorchis viverrini]|uniref:Uncharacterized protein n=1 Tax=Opisthorchis viverrini TaxID=6198 RepID=A0A075A3E4_OPIVI|nr:hypothetical protein T265_03449 [Opisthorchis viverrini]KER30085.1 hypothetical protein T265_03449 [Opisthorchis viverrini]
MFGNSSISATSSLSSLTSESSDVMFSSQSNTAAAGNRSEQRLTSELRFGRWIERETSSVDADDTIDNGYDVPMGGFRWDASGQELSASHFPVDPADFDLIEVPTDNESPPYSSLDPIRTIQNSQPNSYTNCLIPNTPSGHPPLSVSRSNVNFDSFLSGPRCPSAESETTPTKPYSGTNPAHAALPSLIRNSCGIPRETAQSHLLNRYPVHPTPPRNHSGFNLEEHSNDTDQPTLLELTGDVRTVDMQALDQLPIRTWLL